MAVRLPVELMDMSVGICTGNVRDRQRETDPVLINKTGRKLYRQKIEIINDNYESYRLATEPGGRDNPAALFCVSA